LHCGQRGRKGIILMATTHHRWVSQIMAPSIAKRLLVWVIGTRVPEKPTFVNGSLWSGGMVFNTRLTTNEADDIQPAWSPDGTRLAFTSNRDGNGEIYVMYADGSEQTRLTTSDENNDEYPAWLP
ncbi:MAG: hypothetical protein HC884_11335, partial [Chloroflexaceae bacterium]|nr:hypothetical protein [Chloroflexaceae bacterium]